MKPDVQALAQMLETLSAAPAIMALLEEQARQLAALRADLQRLVSVRRTAS